MPAVIRFLDNENGASAAEYALILSILGAAVAVGAYGLGGAIGDEMNEAGVCVDQPSGC